MGALTLPDSEPVYLDSCGFIYSVERVEPYRTLLEPHVATGCGRPVRHCNQ